MMLADLHTHCFYSPDTNEPLDAMLERAMSLGLDAYAITDHCEADRYFSREHYHRPPTGYEFDIYDYRDSLERSLAAVTAAKDRLSGKLNLLCGVELGQSIYDLEASEQILSDSRLDYVIASLHELENNADFAFLDYREVDVPSLLHAYFSDIVRICRWGKFDILGHLTYTLRYIEGKQGIPVDLKPYGELIREAFRLLIAQGKGIEINTSGLRQSYGKTFPTFEYVKLFREMGGEVVSVGSDAHYAKDLACGIREGLTLAKDAGFSYITYFKNRKPHFLKID